MKIKYSICTLFVGALALASCNNDLPTFNDADAFAAFTKTTYSIGENDEVGEIDIPVTFASLAGLEASVNFSIDKTSTAVEGTNFTILNTSKTLSFTKDEPVQYIKIKVKDNSVYAGDVSVVFNLSDPVNAKLGSVTACTLKIGDDEHPLAAILGTYHASAASIFSSRGSFDWNVTLSKDASDVTKVWISNLEPYFASYGYVAPECNYFYGSVVMDGTNPVQIKIPVGQKLGYKNSDGVEILLWGLTGPTGDDNVLGSDGYIVINVKNNGASLEIANSFGAVEATNLNGGWWNLMPGLTMTKN